MTLERWRQIEDLYHAALEREPADRFALLDEVCAGDNALRSEVISLLASHDQTSDFIEAPPDDVIAGMMAEEQARSMTGRTLGRYKIQSLIGAGGMGEVYLARDTRLDRDVAVKILPEHLAGHSEALRRFEREARAVAALSHRNILAIYDFGVEQGMSYAVTELLEGETLRKRLSRSPLAWRETVEIGIAIAEGLSAAHDRGIIHRDLKPENIFLTRDGQVKILDFGIARVKHLVSSDAETVTSTFTKMTKPGLVVGTIGYMSPEQVRGEPAEAPSDLFSLGCVMYESLSGRRPFARDTNAEIIAAILKEEPPPLQNYASEVPTELGRVISEALRKDSGERYQTAGDLLNDLKAASNTQGEIAPAAQPRMRIKQAIGAAIGLAALILGVAAYRIWIQNPARAGANVPAALNTSRVEVMRYYLEIESDGVTPARATGAEPIEAERKFRFHFTPSNRGHLYIIAPGENNVPTTFLTSAPIADSGVTTNLAEAGADYSFPSGAGNGITLGYYGSTTNFTIIFSPSPLAKPGFLSARAYRQLTADEQRELASLWERFGKEAPKPIQQTDGNQPVAIVTVPAEPGNDAPIIFDIPLRRR